MSQSMETQLRSDFRRMGWKRDEITIKYGRIKINTAKIKKNDIRELFEDYLDYTDVVKINHPNLDK